jgi:hypothetical protein
MNGTGVADDPSGDQHVRLDIPAPVVSIRVDGIRAFHTYDEDDGPVLVVTDGDITVEFLCGFSGHSAATIRGAHRLADSTRAYSLEIEARRLL